MLLTLQHRFRRVLVNRSGAAVVIAIVYFCLGWLLLRWLSRNDILPFWAASGGALAVLVHDRRYLPSSAAGVAGGELLLGLLVTHDTLIRVWWSAVANTVEMVVAGLAIHVLFRLGRERRAPEIGMPTDVVRVVLGVAMGAVCGAIVGALAFSSKYDRQQTLDIGTKWFVGDGIGMLALGPIGMLLGSRHLLPRTRRQWLGLAAMVLTVGAVTVAAFATEVPIAYVIPPAVGAVGLRYGPAVVPVSLVVLTWAIRATQYGHGPFILLGRDPLLQLQLFSLALMVTSLASAAVAMAADRRQRRIDFSQDLKRRLIDAASEAYLEVEGHAGLIVDVNDRLASLFGTEPSALLGRTLKSLMPDASWDQSAGARQRIIAGNPAVFEVSMASPLGERRLLVSGRPDLHADGSLARTLMLITDVTELYAERSARQRIEHRLIDVERAERERLAQELHDGPVQLLVAADLQLGRLRRRLPTDDAAMGSKVEEMIESAITALRQGMLDMRPPDVRSGGLLAAIEESSVLFLADSEDVRISIDGDLDQPPNGDEAEVLYKCAREAIANAVRHARCSHIEVTLRRTDQHVQLTVADDGIGMDLTYALGRDGHLGVGAMHARAEDLGGTCRISSGPTGTTVVVELPTTRQLGSVTGGVRG